MYILTEDNELINIDRCSLIKKSAPTHGYHGLKAYISDGNNSNSVEALIARSDNVLDIDYMLYSIYRHLELDSHTINISEIARFTAIWNMVLDFTEKDISKGFADSIEVEVVSLTEFTIKLSSDVNKYTHLESHMKDVHNHIINVLSRVDGLKIDPNKIVVNWKNKEENNG